MEEAKAATSEQDDKIRLFPFTAEERKLHGDVTSLIAIVQALKLPWMSKRRTQTLDNLMAAELGLMSTRRWLESARLNSLQRRYLVAAKVYHCDFTVEPFRATKLKGDSFWDRMRKSLGKEHQAQVDKLYTALKAYVDSVSLFFISATNGQ